MPSLIYGLLALISALAVFVLPETLHSKLPDTVYEAELAVSTATTVL